MGMTVARQRSLATNILIACDGVYYEDMCELNIPVGISVIVLALSKTIPESLQVLHLIL